MKRVLTGLMLFSQAAMGQAIDKTNYQTKICDDDLFKPVSNNGQPGRIDMVGMPVNTRNTILNMDNNYCIQKHHYEAANVNIRHNGHRRPCEGYGAPVINDQDCADIHGVALAKNCEQLKRYKKDAPKAWNEYVATREKCGNR